MKIFTICDHTHLACDHNIANRLADRCQSLNPTCKSLDSTVPIRSHASFPISPARAADLNMIDAKVTFSVSIFSGMRGVF